MAGAVPLWRCKEATGINVSILIATYGSDDWQDLAWSRAYPSAVDQGADEVLCFHDPEGSIASVRNEVANQAKGEWLLYLDADDELAPGYVDAMATAYAREREYRNGNFLLTPAVQQIRKGRPGKPFFFPECDFTTGNWMVIGTLVEREVFREVGGFREYQHGLEDWNLWARCVRHGAKPVKVEKAVYKAYYNGRSKHHVFMRDRKAYMVEYEAARVDAWG